MLIGRLLRETLTGDSANNYEKLIDCSDCVRKGCILSKHFKEMMRLFDNICECNMLTLYIGGGCYVWRMAGAH